MKKKRKFSFNVALFIFLIILAVIQVVILNSYSTIGRELAEVKKEIKTLEDENTRLSQKIASASSLMTISNKAKALGLAKHYSVITFSSPPPLAFSSETSY